MLPSFCSFFQAVDPLAPRGADAHARFLGHLLDPFDEVPAPLFGRAAEWAGG